MLTENILDDMEVVDLDATWELKSKEKNSS